MVFLKGVLVFCAVLVCIQAAKLPEYFSRCNKNLPPLELGKCIVESGNNGLIKFSEGDAQIHARKLDPLEVPKLFIDVEGNLKIDITNAVINGISNGKINDATWDFEKKHVNLKFHIPNANLQGTYDISGKILILPINGKGPCNITFVEGDYDLNFDYDIEEKGSKHYFKFNSNKLTYTLKRAHFGLDNLFGGDKRLGEEMAKFLDENWKEVNDEIGVKVGDGFGEIFATALQSVFDKVPMENLFD